MSTRIIPHTMAMCGTCSMWAGEREVTNGACNPRTTPINIRISESKARCNRLGQGSSVLWSPGMRCGRYSPMIG